MMTKNLKCRNISFSAVLITLPLLELNIQYLLSMKLHRFITNLLQQTPLGGNDSYIGYILLMINRC